MAKQITFTYKDKDYTLEYNVKSLQTLENSGFNFKELDTKMATNFPLLFRVAFQMHHPAISQKLRDEMYEKMKGQNLMQVLVEMYADTLTNFLGDEENQEGKIEWKVNG